MSALFEFSHNNPQYSPAEALYRMVQSYQNGGQNSAQAAQAQYMLMGMANAPGQAGQAQMGAKPPMMLGGSIAPNMAAVGRNQEHLGAFASPAMSQIGLPGSSAINGSPHLNAGAGPVHTPSPAQGHMQPPGVMGQQGQQGGGGATAAAAVAAAAGVTPGNTTSPNVTAKRRRQSTIKTEGDEGGETGGGAGEPNGVDTSSLGVGGAGGKVKASSRTGGPAKRAKAG